MTVTAAVEVACWCTTNHNMHPVHHIEWLAGTDDALADAVDAAGSAVHAWLSGPSHPNTWRAKSGLFNPDG